MLVRGLLIGKVVGEEMSDGVRKILYGMWGKESGIKGDNVWCCVFGWGIRMGCGGCVGGEGGIVVRGCGIGWKVGSILGMEEKRVMVVVGCGGGGGVWGMLKGGIGGVVFRVEVVMIEVRMGCLVGLVIRSVRGGCVSYVVRGREGMLEFEVDYGLCLEGIG